MKKPALLLTVLLIVFSLAACTAPVESGGTTTTTTTTATATSDTTTTQSATSPTDISSDCFAILRITINPKFNLYLDKDGVVLDVKPLNDDAASFASSVTYQNCSVETVVQTILTKADENGFTTNDTNVQLEIVELKPEPAADLLEKAADSVADTAEQLELNVEVEVKVFPAPGTSTTDTNTVATTTTATTATADFTSITSKAGSWVFRFMSGTTLYDAYFTFLGEPSYGYGQGDLMTAVFPEEIWEEVKPQCTLYEEKYYYFGRGGGGELQSVTENGNTVTVTDENGNVLVLTRTAENTLLATTVPESFGDLGAIPQNATLTFELNAED